jgi:hypothetical protein
MQPPARLRKSIGAAAIGIPVVTGILIAATGVTATTATGKLSTETRAGPSLGLFRFKAIGIGTA